MTFINIANKDYTENLRSCIVLRVQKKSEMARKKLK